MVNEPEAMPKGKVLIGIAAILQPNGQLSDPRCSSDSQVNCKLIVRNFLSRPRTYTDISGEPSLQVTSIPDRLGECYETTAQGRVQGAEAPTAVVTSKPALFDPAQPKLTINDQELVKIKASVVQSVREKLADLLIPTIARIEKFRLTNNGDVYLVAEGRKDDTRNYSMFFGVWREFGDTLTLVASNIETGFQEPENFIGTIRLKHSESDLIVTLYSHSEGYEFHVYGLQKGEFKRIYVGGGADC
jgi:hypothetical protein